MPAAAHAFDSEQRGLDGRLLHVLLHPVSFFRHMGLGTPPARALVTFAFAALAVSALRLNATGGLATEPRTLLLLAVAPMVGQAAMAVAAALSHALGSLVGAGGEVSDTFKVFLYAFTPFLALGLLGLATGPVTVSLVPPFEADGLEVAAALWSAALVVLGLRETHTVSAPRAALMAAPALLASLATLVARGASYWWIGWLGLVLAGR